jgi:hypothetical protein
MHQEIVIANTGERKVLECPGIMRIELRFWLSVSDGKRLCDFDKFILDLW